MEGEPNLEDVSISSLGVQSNDTSTPAGAQEEIARLRRELTTIRATLGSDSENGIIVNDDETANRTALLEAMLETVPVGVVLADATGRIVHGNSWIERNLRHPVLHSADTASYGEWVSFHSDGRQVESHEYPLSRVIKDGEDHSTLDVNYQRGDGTMFWMRVIGEPVRNSNGEAIGATVALVDIEDEVRLLEEKEILLGEVNHRVKNSLQLVSSILSLQARAAPDDAAELLKAASARVQAISSVHAGLYHDDDVRTVEFGGYLRRFCDRLADAVGAGERKISLQVEAEEIVLSADKAVPLSLIVNELVTNAFKYAFADEYIGSEGKDDSATVTVRLFSNDSGTVCVEVADNGTGTGTQPALKSFTIEQDISSNETSGLGTKLTKILAQQLGATVEKKQVDGWIVKLEFEP
ncbi:two-component sensor histidine kinase [Loktanella ponticola]|uniref:histidine kinase n=1 Tax=Yoonia ponticola TaxID=1524255 RepID=A0A7W9BN56_9RHOB|nr:histidine kinase dimerization/phosphoacceptor domain -containing protein [Yoonia ponticola]MBB5723407.1 two-component sensor histidine kinase [Yoonia ponticola]